MRSVCLGLLLAFVAPASLLPAHAAPINRVILDETEVENLGIKTVSVTGQDFEETLFVLGRTESMPSRRGTVSSRIAGRIIELHAFEGDQVVSNQLIARVESRQPGNPPPTVELRAPLAGLVTHGESQLGEPVEPDREILEIVDLSEVYAVARVPEDQAGLLHPGTRARIRIAALKDQDFAGELLRFGTVANPDSGTVDALFLLANPDGRIRPGMRAEFSIVIAERKDVTAVPREAVQGDNLNPFLFVKDFDLPNAFIKAPVRLGMKNATHVEILGGLFPGDDVVVQGAYPLAYAGGGSLSLKEALDAAHGHEHAEDGSELTAEQRAQHAHEVAGLPAGGSGGAPAQLTIFLGILSALLLVLLILSVVARPRAAKGGANHA